MHFRTILLQQCRLTDNVIGEIPTMGELRAEARPVVQIKGVEEKMK